MAKVNGKYLNDIEDMLSAELQEEYQQVKAAYRSYRTVQQGFEESLAIELGVDPEKLVCSYRFGKLSISIGEAKPKAVQPKAKLNLADWLEQQSR